MKKMWCAVENRFAKIDDRIFCSTEKKSNRSTMPNGGCDKLTSELLKKFHVCDRKILINTTTFLLTFINFALITCLNYTNASASIFRITTDRRVSINILLTFSIFVSGAYGFTNEFDINNNGQNLNLDQIAAVFNKVAYGSTTKRSIPETAYPVTTLLTPLLTTYRYTDGYDEWMRVDTKRDPIIDTKTNEKNDENYGFDLEKDHVLPTSAPAADILKNNNNKNYNNPNRYNNDRLKPDFKQYDTSTTIAENKVTSTTLSWNQRNVRPTKSMYTKEVPNYVPPQRDLFTPPLPPKFLNPFQDKPTLRGTNNDFVHRRPVPPPSLIPNKERIPFRPDLPKVNMERVPQEPTSVKITGENASRNNVIEKKKSLNTPSHNVRIINENYNSHRSIVNESNFEYDKGYLPAITRILSGPNGRNDDFPDLLLQSVSSTPNFQEKDVKIEEENGKIPKDVISSSTSSNSENLNFKQQEILVTINDPMPPESVTVQKNEENLKNEKKGDDTESRGEGNDVLTTQISDIFNLKNVKEKKFVSSDEIWLICWNVHVYLVVIAYIFLAMFSIYKLIRYENEPHMFSKNYFLTIHLMLTVICVLRIFYLIYDAYNVNNSFNIFLYDFLHNFPLSLMATTFSILILFLLKRTLTHLEIKTRPIFLVVFSSLHIVLCFVLSVLETFGQIEKAGLIICKPIFVLLSWALGVSYLYLYRIIKKVLAKKSQNMSEICTQNISYASHITIAVALLFVLLGFVQLYALFFIEIDKFEIKNHWILWGFELSVRFIEISIITLLAIVVSLKMSQREKQNNGSAGTGGAGGFPLFPCTSNNSDSSNTTDNIYPNNCNTNPNVMNYTLRNNELLQLQHQQQNDIGNNAGLDPHFERNALQNSSRKTNHYESSKYYTKPKYDDDDLFVERNIYSEPVDNGANFNSRIHEYERTRHEFEFDRRSISSGGRNSGRKLSNHNSSGTTSSSMGRSRKNHIPRTHLGGVHTLPNQQQQSNLSDSMLVDEQGFVRFRHMQDEHQLSKKSKKFINDNHQYGDV